MHSITKRCNCCGKWVFCLVGTRLAFVIHLALDMLYGRHSCVSIWCHLSKVFTIPLSQWRLGALASFRGCLSHRFLCLMGWFIDVYIHWLFGCLAGWSVVVVVVVKCVSKCRGVKASCLKRSGDACFGLHTCTCTGAYHCQGPCDQNTSLDMNRKEK